MEDFEEIIFGSKQYKFEYGTDGMSVLVIDGYYSGKSIKLDLSVLLEHQDVLAEMIEKANESDEY